MPAPPVQPIVIWFGRVGDLILLSALLEILHRRFGSPCHVIGAGAWPAEIYAAHSDVARVSCLHRYTAWVFDPAWWRTRRALRAGRAGPVYVCETDPRKLARIRRLLRLLALCARSHSMISVDTGPAHAAAALGLPLVVLFGAHSQQQWLPRSPCGSPVLGVGGPPLSTRLDQVSVETVFAAWCALG